MTPLESAIAWERDYRRAWTPMLLLWMAFLMAWIIAPHLMRTGHAILGITIHLIPGLLLLAGLSLVRWRTPEPLPFPLRQHPTTPGRFYLETLLSPRMPGLPIFALTHLTLIGLTEPRSSDEVIAATFAGLVIAPLYAWLRWKRWKRYADPRDRLLTVGIPLALILQAVIPYPFGNQAGMALILAISGFSLLSPSRSAVHVVSESDSANTRSQR
jgi:hypothetical protein